ncbi:C6 transcription [Cordyceps militaris]|uniref:C6 transcription n=1 Tax=Cordyceps militaris TaxID=73501 RepID=A0A2H4SGE2_CORMI|nr:C6 transcription [Cordyceps militaris]
MAPENTPRTSADGSAKTFLFSCLVCRQRKVRCDRVQPCGNCARANVECEYVMPVRGRRTRSKPVRETMHAKLRRYEDMLKTRGLEVGVEERRSMARAISEDGASESYTATESITSLSVPTPTTRAEAASPPMGLRSALVGTPGSGPNVVNVEGNSRYYDNSTLWTDTNGEFRHPDEFTPLSDDDEDETDLFLGSSSLNCGFNGSLRDCHPTLHCLYALKDVYMDRVDPLMKIIHLPTFWESVRDAAERKEQVSKPIEAVIFCFYFATISVVDEKQCEALFKESKRTMFSRYRAIARHALRQARLLSTSSPMTLRAFCLFMMGMRGTMPYESQHILCGIALRLAQKMGLHRDGTLLGLSLFETEMRRRLWWYIAHLDFRTSDLLGAKPSLDIHTGDAGVPWNVEDEDLQPSMTEVPKDRKAITSITMCLVRCDLSKSLQRLSGMAGTSAASWGDIGTASNMSAAEKDALIDGLEDKFETKYLRYCDPSRPLDVLVTCMMRAAICNTRLFAHNPRRFADSGGQVTEAERGVAFSSAAKLLEYASMVGENRSLRKFAWRLNPTYLWDKMLFVLIEARRRTRSPDLDRVWALIGRVFSQYPDAFGQASAQAVYQALSKWTLEVWDGYVAAKKAEGMPEPEEPAYIGAMREKLEMATPAKARKEQGVGNTSIMNTGPEKTQEVPLNAECFGEFPDLGSFEMDLDQWVNWEQLVSEQSGSGFYHVEGY